ncbi:DNA cytosine methyltransferase [Cellulomonas sp. Leaf334]|uniref:DNA cytosine methyltransferase n=1 Tax=Cellulomonas sp. Leaf334 TaxID=1736339 RepID=UPI0009EC3A1E|nr:DNA cytosine methyltransferase [Cellulomonas sp. Leaf334]
MDKSVLSCFSGAGGMDLGLEAAGFTSVGCIELEELPRNTLIKNRPEWPILEPHDVVAAGATLRPQDLDLEPRELTLLAGGPPCQPFSMAAQWQKPKPGTDDDRGKTVLGMLNLVDRFLPSAILIENVAGFLQGRNSAVELISHKLGQINDKHQTSYRLEHWILNAADYGVPQNRRRAIGIAFRDGAPAEGLARPAPSHSGNPVTAWDAISDLTIASVPRAEGGYADLLPSIPEGGNYLHLTARGGGPSVELFGYRTRYWSFLLKLRRDAPAWTLPASPGPSTGPFHWDNRPLAIEERLALQGFPSSWELAGSPRDAVRLVGNATPPPLAEAMGRYISTTLLSSEVPTAEQLRPTIAVRRKEAPPNPIPPVALPERWKARVYSRDAHPGAGAGPAGHPTEQNTRPS